MNPDTAAADAVDGPVVDARSQLYSNESNSLRPYYYIFERHDDRGLFRLRMNYKYHKIRQKRNIRFTKQTRGYSYEYVHHSNIVSLFKIAMFEYLGRCVVNVGSIVSRGRRPIQSMRVDIGEPDERGHVWYHGKMYNEYTVVSEPPPDEVYTEPLIRVVHPLPERVALLDFCTFARDVLFDGDEKSTVAMNKVITRVVVCTNEILRIYNLMKYNNNITESVEFLNASITPTLYDFEFAIGLMRWKSILTRPTD